jgi:hypothetical protein
MISVKVSKEKPVKLSNALTTCAVIATVGGSALLAPAAAFASGSKPTIRILQSYYIENEPYNQNAGFWADGPPGQNVGTPPYWGVWCGDFRAYWFNGWSVSGVAAVKNYATPAASHADTRAPGMVALTMTDQAGDVIKVSGGDTTNNPGDYLVGGGFKIVARASDGSTTTCTLNASGPGNSDAENQYEED